VLLRSTIPVDLSEVHPMANTLRTAPGDN